MRAAAVLLRERVDAIATMMSQEQGKPLAEAKGETLAAADIIEWFADESRRVYGRVVPPRNMAVQSLVLKEPVGPVAAFTPWNFPINQVVRKVCAALTTGCSIIVKAPEETPASPAALMKAFADAGVPAGVIGLVYGNPAEISGYLIPHPVIRKITFTGSTPVGKQLAALAGQHMKRATMELGGHAPVIVAEDADIAQAVKAAGAAKFRNAGQVCISPTRFLVHNSILRRVRARAGGADAEAQGRRGHGRGHDDGPAGQSAAPGRDAADHGRRGQARRQGGHRRRAHRLQRQLLRADGADRGAPGRDGLQPGALRPDGRAARLRHAGRSDRREQPPAVRAGQLCLHAVAGHRACAVAARSRSA